MRDVNNGWLIRYIHSNTASAFFFIVYLHIGRGLYYGCAPCRGFIVVKLENFYHCLVPIIATELGRRESRGLNRASLLKWLQLLTRKVIIELWAIYSMVKAILPEANGLLIPNIGYYHYGERIVKSKEQVDPYCSNQSDFTRCEIITLKDQSLQPKEYVRTIKNTTGLPKESHFQGNRVTILGKLYSWRVTANKRSNVRYYCTSGTSDVVSRLEKLRVRSENRPKHTINKNLHSLVYNENLLNLAYDLIKSKASGLNMRPFEETLDLSQDILKDISEQLKNETFIFKPSRLYIGKANGGLRPLTIASPRDKLVQQVIKMILELVFEPIFLDNSHGFRAKLSTQTAFLDVRRTFRSVAWVIEGDFEKGLDSIDHKLLMNILESKILDRRFTNLIRKALKAGYFEFQEVLNTNIAGTKGSIVSPILANIFLHQLDLYVESLRTEFNRDRPRTSLGYKRIRPLYRRALYHKDVLQIREIMNRIRKIDHSDYSDPNYKRLAYIRYGDVWLIGIRGSYHDALQIKSKVAEFCNSINLKLSEKTRITSLNKKVLFLGVQLTRSHQNTFLKINRPKRQAQELRLLAPIQNIVKRLHKQGFMKNNKSQAKFIWMSYDLRRIMGLYNSVVRGYLNYYSFVHNYGTLKSRLMFILKSSCCKLIACKLKLKTINVYKKFGKTLRGAFEGSNAFVGSTIRVKRAKALSFKPIKPVHKS